MFSAARSSSSAMTSSSCGPTPGGGRSTIAASLSISRFERDGGAVLSKSGGGVTPSPTAGDALPAVAGPFIGRAAIGIHAVAGTLLGLDAEQTFFLGAQDIGETRGAELFPVAEFVVLRELQCRVEVHDQTLAATHPPSAKASCRCAPAPLPRTVPARPGARAFPAPPCAALLIGPARAAAQQQQRGHTPSSPLVKLPVAHHGQNPNAGNARKP